MAAQIAEAAVGAAVAEKTAVGIVAEAVAASMVVAGGTAAAAAAAVGVAA